jgi:non-ribosomal peptide synthetase component F
VGYLWEIFSAAGQAHPDREFITSRQLSLTYGEAAAAALRLGRDLAAHPSPTPVAIPDSVGAWETVAILAASWAGRSPAPYLARDRADVERVAALNPSAHVMCVGDVLTAQPWRTAAVGGKCEGGAGFAYILSTSGSTGRPKHVAVGEGQLRAYASYARAGFAVSSDDVIAQVYRPHFDAFYNVLLLCILNGASLAVPQPGEMLLVSDFVNRYQVTVWDSVPSLVRLGHRAGKLPAWGAESVRLAVFGGEPLRVEDLDLWRTAAPHSTVVNSYGPSEMTIAMCEYRLEPGEAPVTDHGYVAIGQPVGATEVRLRSHVRPGHFELLARGPQRFAGYLEEHGAPCFVDDEDRPVADGRDAAAWFVTGDIVTLQEGQLCYQGRADRRTEKVLGQRFDPEEVEMVLVQDARVARAFVHVVEDRVTAVLERASGLSAGEDEPVDCAMLRPYARPHRLLWVDSFPLLPSGKSDTAALRTMARESSRHV